MDLEAEDKTAALRAEGCYDAVTSATNTKSKKYGATYYTENEDGSVTVEGIRDVAIAVPRKLYEDATAAIADGKTCNNQLLNIIGNMTVSESQDAPAEYKFLNGDGTVRYGGFQQGSHRFRCRGKSKNQYPLRQLSAGYHRGRCRQQPAASADDMEVLSSP